LPGPSGGRKTLMLLKSRRKETNGRETRIFNVNAFFSVSLSTVTANEWQGKKFYI
jgi:hypothetical protein